MFSLYMDGQNKTNQIMDWKLYYKQNKIMVTVTFHSGKSFAKPLDLCEIRPQIAIENGLIYKEGSYQAMEYGISYGNKYTIVKYVNNPKKYIMKSSEISIVSGSEFKNGTIFKYFRDVTKKRMSLATQDNIAMFENTDRQLDKVTPYRGTALHAYCYAENETRDGLAHLIFPFGLNESQLLAVENAFSSQISIIEGPPGTGKTQTILNIIANILINKKTVGIVSNNNLAVENIYEKMAKEGLDYLVAKLGCSKKKKRFFSSLKTAPIYATDDSKIDIEDIDELLYKLKGNLVAKNKVAQLTAEISELTIEYNYLKDWHEDNVFVKLIDVAPYKLSPEKTSDLLAYMNYLAQNKVSFKERFRLFMTFKIVRLKFLKTDSERINFSYSLQFYYYEKLIHQKECELQGYKTDLSKHNFTNLLDDLTRQSMTFLKQTLSTTISPNANFTLADYRTRFTEFTKRFPVIGSSTHSIINSIGDGAILDYIIIDEASQQDIVPGILSLGCARNIIVVGDRKQLPHIPQETGVLAPSKYYDCENYSLLDSFVGLLNDLVPVTLLKEHYRCHPKIIQFCNQQFYDNQLIPMTLDKGESAIEMITTAKGNHTRNLSNLREIESLIEVGCDNEAGVGFIAPYNNQVNLAVNYLPKSFAKSTIHKFQGRECSEIIFSTVLDHKRDSQTAVAFVDNPNLVNVAVSRAINKFTLVTGDNVFTKNNQSLAALIRYINYYAPDDHIHNSPVISSFDLLYKSYDKSLEKLNMRLNAKHSSYKSEQIVEISLSDMLLEDRFSSLICHMQIDLIQLVSIKNTSFTQRELEYMRQKASCDFVIYYKVGKHPVAVIEVDGGYHDENIAQRERDVRKNTILKKVHLPLLRLKTTEGNIEKKVSLFLTECMKNKGMENSQEVDF